MSRVFAIWLLVSVLTGCDDVTQVVVELSAQPATQSRARSLRVRVCDTDDVLVVNRTLPLNGTNRFPFRVPLHPSGGDSSRTFSLLAEVTDDSGQVFSEKRVVGGYVSDQKREFEAMFDDACLDQFRCTVGETCEGGVCVSALLPPRRVDSAICDPARAQFPGLDGGPPRDGAVPGPDGRVLPDGGIPDAGPIPDGGMLDGGPLPNECAGPYADALICDGFDAPDLAPWQFVVQRDGVTSRTVDPVLAGAGALSVETSVAGAAAYIEQQLPRVIDTGVLHVRAYVYVPSGTVFGYYSLLAFREGGAPFGVATLAIRDGARLDLQAHPFSDGNDETATAAVPLPLDRWVCLQMAIDVAASGGSMAVSVDGSVVTQMNNVVTAPAAGFAELSVGAIFTSADQPPSRIYVDELVADTSTIPCR